MEGLSDEIGSNISSLGVDSSTDSSEEGNGGSSKTVSSNELEKSSSQLLNSGVLGNSWGGISNNLSELSIVPGGLEDDDDKLEDEESKSDEGESKYLSTSEGSEETIMGIFAALEGSSSVGEDGNSHSNVSSGDGSSRSNKVGGGGVWEVSWMILV